jgi:hypothetical protein
MKTLRKNGQIKRVSDTSPTDNRLLTEMIDNGWNYIPKSEWKPTRPVKVEKAKKGDKKKAKKETKKEIVD